MNKKFREQKKVRRRKLKPLNRTRLNRKSSLSQGKQFRGYFDNKIREQNETINLLEGLSFEQVVIIRRLVRTRGLIPWGFDVDISNDKIYYMGEFVC